MSSALSESHSEAIEKTPFPALAPEVSLKIRWREGWDAFVASSKDADDTGAAIRMIDAFSGKSGEREFKRFWESVSGQEILGRKSTLLDVLSHREGLAKLPEGSFGRAYLDWVKTEEISAQELAKVSEVERIKSGFPAPLAQDPRKIFYDRLREMHDLLHVLTGYGRDLIGESGVLTFTYSQTRSTGIGSPSATA